MNLLKKEEELTVQERYVMLQDFLKKENLKILGQIDIWPFQFNFALEKTEEFTSVLYVYEMFEKYGFKNPSVRYRDYRKENSLHPILSEGVYISGGKEFYEISVSQESEFFEK